MSHQPVTWSVLQQRLRQRDDGVQAALATTDIAFRHSNKVGAQVIDTTRALHRQVTQHAHGWLQRSPLQWTQDWLAYCTDMAQRQILTLDALRERGNTFVAHEEAGMPPVLDFEYQLLLDGTELERPVNYQLLRIVPPPGVTVDEHKRPFMIIDPRAGHGAGIGGFKPESQVGQAFADGHPVYFVAFQPIPQPDQTLADVRDAEVEFLREVARRHPDAPKPVVIGNCQGGWASMLVAASAPDDVGPIVINGSPMSYWAGTVGENPMRYVGGLRGGAAPALLMSDLGAGIFDGSALVMNFEALNPSNSLFRKLYTLYSRVDTEAERFVEFERWWGGFFLMNEAEIRWIVENLFIGNRLARGEAVLGGERVDLHRIHSPIIVFASQGDNITPPAQALNWIADLYDDVDEIKARGQRIIYMIHPSIGHLGIFVSSKIAGKEYDAITDTLRAIDALAPGLYEMRLDDGEDRVHVRFEPRTLDDLQRYDDGRGDEELFASVSRLSSLGTEMYEMLLRPWVQALVSPQAAERSRALAPIRVRRTMFADSHNPWMPLIGQWAGQVRAARRPVSADNPFVLMESVSAHVLEASLDLYRDVRDALQETAFHAIYGTPALRTIGAAEVERLRTRRKKDLRALPNVREALDGMAEGDAADGTLRMLCLLTRARGYVRRSRLENQIRVFQTHPAFVDLSEEDMAEKIRVQTIVTDFEPEKAMATLPLLLDTDQERSDALSAVMDIAGPRATMHPSALVLYQHFESILGTVDGGPGVHQASSPRALVGVEVSEPVARAPHIAPASGPADDLEEIIGIGPRLAEKLQELGFTRFAQLAALSPAEVAWLDLKINGRGRIAREDWVGQASHLSRASIGDENI